MAQDYLGIPMSQFTCGNRAPVDLYLSLGEQGYIKVVKKGDAFEKDRLRSYQDRAVTHVYLQRRDFGTYITYCMALLKRLHLATKHRPEKDFGLTGRVTELVFLGLRANGPKSEVKDQLSELCEIIVEQSRDRLAFGTFVSDMMDLNDGLARHCLGSALLVLTLVNGMKWQSERNVRAVVLGALLHDVALLNFPQVYSEPRTSWSDGTEEAYANHTVDGAGIILSKKIVDDDRIVRIVADHHELPDGSGFPNGLESVKIFPMTYPVIMADRLVDLIFGPDSPLEERSYSEGLRYLKNRESKFFPVNYWDALERATSWIG